ncbi:hypothetical protein KY290_007559 [Solanum tuberosum]|uniref:SWIM-type domain-containing protein n=1 Tax=Solanum tuberosum TaxID=4113 RepID=A0ABQ7W611_SOLTU|nr:hypothetical protein KY290_007559 [Solanum tuberosum]
MNISDDEIGHDVDEDQTPTPIVDIGGSSQLKQLNNLQDDETGFYIGMTFKNKEELVTSLHIVCLKKDFRLAKYHRCGSEHITSHNPHATAKVLDKYFKNSFPNGKDPSTRDMTNQFRTKLGCKVSYWKIYKGREIAKSLVRGTHEHGYGVLDACRYMLESANLGSKTALQVDENGKFKYFFVAYAAWIQGFQQLRKVIAVDGTFLKSKYEGVLLSAVAQDAENYIFPVVFCVVDKECDASYQYFFEQMRSYVDDTDELCIISDRHSTKAYNKVEFYDHFNQIRDMLPKAAEHLESIEFHRWSKAFCPGNRYNIMTSNIAESVNAIFQVEREFPIVALFDEINMTFAKLFHERRMELVNSPNILVPSMEKQISKNINLGNKLMAHQIANYKFSINGHGDVATVDLQRRTCTCRVFDLDKIPCPHAMAALRSQYGAHFGNQIYEYSSSYYSVEKYIIAYCEEINPVPPEDSWIVPLEILEREIPPPYVDPSKPGRRRTKRRRGVGE